MVNLTYCRDEADLLGDRIAIMADGQLRASGSSLFLKNRWEWDIDKKVHTVCLHVLLLVDIRLNYYVLRDSFITLSCCFCCDWLRDYTCRILKVQYASCFSILLWGLLSEYDTEQFEYDTVCNYFSTFFVSPIPFHSNVKECKDVVVLITVSVYML